MDWDEDDWFWLQWLGTSTQLMLLWDAEDANKRKPPVIGPRLDPDNLPPNGPLELALPL